MSKKLRLFYLYIAITCLPLTSTTFAQEASTSSKIGLGLGLGTYTTISTPLTAADILTTSTTSEIYRYKNDKFENFVQTNNEKIVAEIAEGRAGEYTISLANLLDICPDGVDVFYRSIQNNKGLIVEGVGNTPELIFKIKKVLLYNQDGLLIACPNKIPDINHCQSNDELRLYEHFLEQMADPDYQNPGEYSGGELPKPAPAITVSSPYPSSAHMAAPLLTEPLTERKILDLPNISLPAQRNFNNEYTDFWNRIYPMLEVRLAKELKNIYHKKFIEIQDENGQSTSNFKFKALLIFPPELNISGAPGFEFPQSAADEFRFKLPYQGTWDLTLKMTLKMWYKNVGLGKTRVALSLKGFKFEVPYTLDTSDPEHPKFDEFHLPKFNINICSTSDRVILSPLFGILTNYADAIVQDTIKATYDDVKAKLDIMSGRPLNTGKKEKLLDDRNIPDYPLRYIVANVDNKLPNINMPYDTVLPVKMDTPSRKSWRESYGPDGSGNIGKFDEQSSFPYVEFGDSAIWTGHYLASQAFRFASSTRSQDNDDANLAIKNIKKSLRGIDRLLRVYDNSGLLARAAFPIDSPVSEHLLKNQKNIKKSTIDGKEWVVIPGGNGISRDQYAGIFFGLSITYDLVNDQKIKSQIRHMIKIMLDYFIRSDWYIDEDRSKLSDLDGQSFPTTWAGVPIQKLTYLVIGHHIWPQNKVYKKELTRYGAQWAEVSWIPLWTTMFDTVTSYYKFNLSFITLYNYFRLEEDPVRLQYVARGFHMFENFLGHHLNPHFDLIRLSVHQRLGTSPLYGKDIPSRVRYAISQFTKRNHRHAAPVDPERLDFSDVEWDGTYADDPQRKMPLYPLDPELRSYASNFQWQRSSFKQALLGEGDPYLEKPGTDLLLPYWMGRFYSVFE